MKLVSEPIRILLWLDRAEQFNGPTDTLWRGLQAMPQHEEPIVSALELKRSLGHSPAAPLGEMLGWFVELSSEIARRIGFETKSETALPRHELGALEPHQALKPEVLDRETCHHAASEDSAAKQGFPLLRVGLGHLAVGAGPASRPMPRGCWPRRRRPARTWPPASGSR